MTNIKNDIFVDDFDNEWGHFIDTEELIYSINNEDLMRMRYNYNFCSGSQSLKKYKFKKYSFEKYNMLETINEEYDYYLDNKNNKLYLDSLKQQTTKYKMRLPTITSTVCFTMFITTLIIFII
jgi:hypothetical protein